MISVISMLFYFPSHWEKMSAIAGRDLTPEEGTNVSDYISMGLEKYLEQFENISETAKREASLENTLNRMIEEWKDVVFNMIDYRDTGSLLIEVINLVFYFLASFSSIFEAKKMVSTVPRLEEIQLRCTYIVEIFS